MKIGFAQIKDQRDFQDNINQCLDFMALASKMEIDILCFPEMQFSYFFPRCNCERMPFQWAEGIPGPTVEIFQRKAKETGLVVILNCMERFNQEFYNSSPIIDSD